MVPTQGFRLQHTSLADEGLFSPNDPTRGGLFQERPPQIPVSLFAFCRFDGRVSNSLVCLFPPPTPKQFRAAHPPPAAISLAL